MTRFHVGIAICLPTGRMAKLLIISCALGYGFARHNGRTEIATLLLVGVALNAISAAVLNFLQYVSSEMQLQTIVFWLMGSVSGATWQSAGFAALPIAIAVPWALLLANRLNILLLGDAEAWHLGISVETLRLTGIGLISLLTGVSVALAGIVAFVGLISPHIVRMVFGPDHRNVLSLSMVTGAGMTLTADALARTLVLPAQMPLGLVVAFLGGPLFLCFILRTRCHEGCLS